MWLHKATTLFYIGAIMKKVIESFCGNVVPLCFDGEGEVKWYADSDAVSIRRFDTGELAFDKGVLLIFLKKPQIRGNFLSAR